MQVWMEGPTGESAGLYIIYNLETDHGHMFSFRLPPCFSNAMARIISLQYFNTGAKIL